MQILNKFNKLKPEFLDSFSINVFIIRKCIISENVIIFTVTSLNMVKPFPYIVMRTEAFIKIKK